MKPIPDIANDAAMILRGKRSALGTARNEAAEALRDAMVHVQASDWHELHAAIDALAAPAERLKTLSAMWSEL